MFPVCHPRRRSGIQGLFFFLRGSAPTRRGSFDYAQDRLFCFGKRTQNHWRPGVALRVSWPQSRLLGLPSTSGALRLTLRMKDYHSRLSVPPPVRPERNGVESKGAQTVLAPK